jgi:sugar lactone lactonase YvrE
MLGTGAIARVVLALIAAAGIAGHAGAQIEEPASLDGVHGEDGSFTPISGNVTVFPVVDNAESCVYDAGRGLVLALNRAKQPREALDDAYVSMLRADGTVETARWDADGLVMNQPYGSAIAGGLLYVADRDGGTSKDNPSRAVLRVFDLATGAPVREVAVDSPGLNDIAVGPDGTVYATQTSLGRGKNEKPDPANWKVFAIAPDDTVSVLIEGAPLAMPNGIEVDGDGNLVVVNTGDAAVVTFSPDGAVMKTEEAAQAGNDGLVLMPDGTKYVGSIREGGISRIAPDGTAELIATGIPGAASMCLDAGANALVVPLGMNNAVAVVPLD